VIDLISFEGAVRYQRGQLVVCPPEEDAKVVPLADVGMLLLGPKTVVGKAVFHQLAEFDVVVLLCDWRGVPIGGMYGWRDHSRVGARHKAQSEATEPRKKNAWGQIIRAKITGQATNLRVSGNRDWRVLAAMAREVRSGDPDNVEARAARYYWSRLFADQRFLREPGAGVGRNALLDYGYMVLRGHAVRAVLAAGLSPSLGLFHKGRDNFFNLADDIIEPFRPAVDSVVTELKEGMSPAHASVKARLVQASSQPFDSSGISVTSAVTDLAQQLGGYLEGKVDRLRVSPWAGSVVGTLEQV
jgi:CRISPR-associated protein Cas1